MTLLDKPRTYIPAAIRGFTSDGETALVVTELSQADVPAELCLDAPDDDITETLDRWRIQFTTYVQLHRSYPKTVSVQNFNWLYGLGVSLDEAMHAKGVSRSPDVLRSKHRGDTMKGKVAVVTGGAQGFGEGIVRSLIAEGSFAFIADVNLAGAKTLAAELNAKAAHTVAIPVHVDVTDEASVEAMMDRVAITTGCCDLFVSNAGVLRAGSVKEMSLKDFQFVTSVDYTGFFICTKFASILMGVQDKASNGTYMTDIIAISSKSGLEGSNRNGAYVGAKFGTIGLVQSFALELIDDHIKVNAVCPGNFLDGPLWSDPDKGLFVQYLQAGKVPGAKSIADVRRFYESKVPMKRGCTTEDVVRAICYIVEQKYETGQSVPVTGGQVMLN